MTAGGGSDDQQSLLYLSWGRAAVGTLPVNHVTSETRDIGVKISHWIYTQTYGLQPR